MIMEWLDGFEIKTDVKGNSIVISANKEGLLSLAKHLIELEERLTEMIIERIQ